MDFLLNAADNGDWNVKFLDTRTVIQPYSLWL
jgi:hypothetical protein